MKAKHTPGPWTAQYASEEKHGWYIYADHAALGKRMPALADSEPNARLIAAAPTQHEALRRVERELAALLESNGWQSAIANSPDDATSEWVGPRVFKALDIARAALALVDGEG